MLIKRLPKILHLLFLVLTVACSLQATAQNSPVIITSPYYTPDHGYSIGGTATLAVKIPESSNVQKVEFYVDGKLVNIAEHYPYSCQWPGSLTTTGLHDLEVIAYHDNGNKESLLQAFTVEAKEATAQKQSLQESVTKGADSMYYKLDASANSHAGNHTEGLSLWRSSDKTNWTYAGLVWSFEGDANDAEKKWTNLTETPARVVKNAAIKFRNNNFYISGNFEPEQNAKLLKSVTGKPEGPYVPAKDEEQTINKFLSDQENDAAVKVFPNPASAAFKLNVSATVNYTVTDLTGKILESGSANSETPIGASLRAGSYFLTILNRDGTKKSTLILKQ